MLSSAPSAPEAARLDALARYHLLDTAPEHHLDELTALAASLCATPIALISLVDGERQWFKSRIGWARAETPRDVSFCGHAIQGDQLFVVPDATDDPRFHDNPLVVGEPHIRFYAGMPLRTPEGQALGTLCVIDRVPRALTDAQRQGLEVLSRQVMAQLELRRQARELDRSVSEQRDARARYRILFDHAPDGIVIMDAEGRLIDANPRAGAMLGFAPEELAGAHISQTVVPAQQPEVASALAALGREGHHNREWRLQRKDGTELVADAYAQVLPDGTAIAIMRDVTERHRAMDALRETEERMRFAMESANVGLWDMDHRSGEIRVSSTFEQQFGLPTGSFDGTFEMVHAAVHAADREMFVGVLTQALVSGADFTVKFRVQWPDGTVRWLNGAGRVHVDPQGQAVRSLGITLDVTERHILEEQYRQSQKMEAIGRLAGGIAHDFNNLLTAILGYSEMLLDEFAPNDHRRADVLGIQQAGARAATLTRQLLAFSRKSIVDPAYLDVNKVVGSMQPMMRRLIGEDIQLEFKLGIDPGVIKADQSQLEQIVMNLAANGRDAMPRGGALTIETAAVTITDHDQRTHARLEPGAYVMLAVTDTGSGMAPDVQAHLFEPFFTTKAPGEGTGLGLATAHGIVTGCGGSISVHSGVGQGTRLELYFPRATEAGVSVDAAPVVTRPLGGSETVLVVEDAEDVRRLAERLLSRQGYRVLVAPNADDARHVFAAHPDVDLLLTDVVMPGRSGPELSRELLGLAPALKVLFMSGYTDDAIVHHGVLSPGIAFMHKPFTADTLGRKVREVLDR